LTVCESSNSIPAAAAARCPAFGFRFVVWGAGIHTVQGPGVPCCAKFVAAKASHWCWPGEPGTDRIQNHATLLVRDQRLLVARRQKDHRAPRRKRGAWRPLRVEDEATYAARHIAQASLRGKHQDVPCQCRS